MARVEVEGDEVVVRLSGWEKLGAFHGDLHLPRPTIKEVRRVDDPWPAIRGLRAPGTGWPRRIALGTWRSRGGTDFVAVYRRGPGLVIDLDAGQRYRRVIVATDTRTIDAITDWMRKPR